MIYHFQWPWTTPTPVSRSRHFWRWISHLQKRYDTNRDSHTPYSTVSFRMTLNDLAKYSMTTSVARNLCDSWVSCLNCVIDFHDNGRCFLFVHCYFYILYARLVFRRCMCTFIVFCTADYNFFLSIDFLSWHNSVMRYILVVVWQDINITSAPYLRRRVFINHYSLYSFVRYCIFDVP